MNTSAPDAERARVTPNLHQPVSLSCKYIAQQRRQKKAGNSNPELTYRQRQTL